LCDSRAEKSTSAASEAIVGDVSATKRPTTKPMVTSPTAPFLAKYSELFDSEDLWAMARKVGAVERERKVDIAALAEASVLALSGLPGTQTSIYANYVQLTGQTLASSSFYERFTGEHAELMRQLAERAIAAVRAVAPTDARHAELAKLLEHVQDVRVADSSSMVLQKLAESWAPSTSKVRPAGFKLHSIISLKDNLPVEHHISPQRKHDNPQLAESALTPGTLYIHDLGYVDEERAVRLVRGGVHVLARLKRSQKPIIHRVHVGRGDRKACRGKSLDDAFTEGLLDFNEDGVVDLDIVLEAKTDEGLVRQTLRVVGLCEKGVLYGEAWFYLTSLPRDLFTAENVSVAYTLRWEIELVWKHLKTGAGMAAIRAWRQESVLCLVHAKIIGLALARLLELSAQESTKEHASGQFAILLALNRSMPMLMAMRLRQRGVTLEEMERRLLLITMQLAKSRRQRRERAKRAQRADLRRDH
jgi:hypothetical protein